MRLSRAHTPLRAVHQTMVRTTLYLHNETYLLFSSTQSRIRGGISIYGKRYVGQLDFHDDNRNHASYVMYSSFIDRYEISLPKYI